MPRAANDGPSSAGTCGATRPGGGSPLTVRNNPDAPSIVRITGLYLPRGLLNALTNVRAPQAGHVTDRSRGARPGKESTSRGRACLQAEQWTSATGRPLERVSKQSATKSSTGTAVFSLCKVLTLHGLLTRHVAQARVRYRCHTAVHTASTLEVPHRHIWSWS